MKKCKGKKKKGYADNAIGNMLTLIIGVGVAVLVLIFVGVLGGQTYTVNERNLEDIGGTVTDEQITVVYNTQYELNYDAINTGTLTIEFANATVIGLNNFTIDYAYGYITPINAVLVGSMNATYTHGSPDIKTSVKRGIVSGFTALEQTGSYLPIIVLAIIIALVLSLILGMGGIGGFGQGRNTAL